MCHQARGGGGGGHWIEVSGHHPQGAWDVVSVPPRQWGSFDQGKCATKPWGGGDWFTLAPNLGGCGLLLLSRPQERREREQQDLELAKEIAEDEDEEDFP